MHISCVPGKSTGKTSALMFENLSGYPCLQELVKICKHAGFRTYTTDEYGRRVGTELWRQRA